MQYYTVTKLCPNCNEIIDTFTHTYGGYTYSCPYCGYFVSRFMIRTKSSYKEDLSKFKFICVDEPYGHVVIVNKNGNVVNLSVDSHSSDDFIESLLRDKDNYKKVTLSYYSDNKINVVDLLELL